jgi:hypothetical protein
MTLDNFKYLFLRQPLYIATLEKYFLAKENGKTKIEYPLGIEGRKCKKIHNNKTAVRPKKEHGDPAFFNQPSTRGN